MRFGPLDQMFRRSVGAHPLHIGVVLELDGDPPLLEELRAHLADRLPGLPALRCLPPRVLGREWIAYPPERLALDRHVRELRARPAGRDEALLEIHQEPLPAGSDPGWDLWLVHGHADRSYLLCYRVQHSLQDGIGAAHTVRQLLDAPVLTPSTRSRNHRLTLRAVWSTLRVLADSWRPVAGWPQLQARPSGTAQLSFTTVGLDRLRQAAAPLGGSVNDGYLAALTGAWRSWYLEQHPGAGCPPLTVGVPVSVRTAAERTAPGNRVGGIWVRLATDRPEPADWLRAVVRQTRRANTIGWPAVGALAQRRCPRPLATWLVTRLATTGATPAVASNVNIGADPLAWGPDRVTSASILGLLAPDQLCYTVLTGYRDQATLHVVHDTALPGADRLPQHWLASLDQLGADRARA